VHLSIAEGGKISFGKNVILAEDVHIFVGAKASLALGDGVFVGRGSTLIANEALQVGTGTQIAHGVTLIDSDHRFSDTTQTLAEQGGVSKRVTVGQHCWLGAGVIVLKGVSIGDRAVIGAGSVVTSSVPEKSVAMGNPAQVRRAFSP
jgi:maltose O-acetyltransferase